MSIHWPCFCTVHVYVVVHFCDSLVFLTGSECVQFFLLFVYICIAVGDLNIKRFMVFICSVNSVKMRDDCWFVDIGGIDYHHCLNFLFIMLCNLYMCNDQYFFNLCNICFLKLKLKITFIFCICYRKYAQKGKPLY